MGKLPINALADKSTKNIQDYTSQIFGGYNQKPRLKTQLFFGDLGAGTMVGTASVATQTSGQPLGLGEAFLFDPKAPNNRPLTDQTTKNYPTITTTVAASGWEYNLPNIAIASDDMIRITFKSNLLTPTLTVKLTSTTGSDTLTWTAQKINIMNNKANEWTTLTLDMSKASPAGTIDYNKFTKIEIVSSVAIALSLYELETANNETNFIGYVHTGQFNCITEFTPTIESDITDIMCKTTVTDVALGSKNVELEFVTKDMNQKDFAFLTGSNVVLRSIQSWTVVNGAKNGQSGNYNNQISTSTLTLPATRLYYPSEVKVSIDGVEYLRTQNVDNVGRGEFCYTQDPVNFTFTFTIGNGDVTGKTPVIELLQTKENIPTVDSIHDLGNYFYMECKQNAGVGKIVQNQLVKCLVTNISTEIGDNTIHTITVRAFPVIEDGKATYTREALIA